MINIFENRGFAKHIQCYSPECQVLTTLLLDTHHSRAGPRLWNTLPLHVRSAETLGFFKSTLKTHFFSLAF